jgi:tripartite-type tricarboxylate transporter receptor subunit TctC
MKRVELAVALCGALLCSIDTTAVARTYPARPVKLVVPYSAGGLPDTMARIVAQRMSESLGQQVFIENKPGAGGIAGADSVAKAAPDGYTLLVADTPQLATNPALYPKLSYNPVKDFAPISMIGVSPLFLVVHESVPAKSLEELIALAKSRPGTGKVRLVAVNTTARSSLASDVPTVGEVIKVTEYNYPGEIGILAPAGTPAPIIARLAESVASAVKNKDTVERFTSLGIEPQSSTPEADAQEIVADIPRYAALVKTANVKID